MTYILSFFWILFATTPTETTTLTVTIDNIETVGGTLEIGLFNNGDKFLEEGQAFKSVSVKVTSTSETFVIKNLPKGNYALSLYHDENSDGKCNRNFMGIPTEAYAFSNNFRPKFSAPTFEDCEFNLNSDQTLKIELNN